MGTLNVITSATETAEANGCAVKLESGIWQPGSAIWEKDANNEWIQRWTSFTGNHMLTIDQRQYGNRDYLQYGYYWASNTNFMGDLTPKTLMLNGAFLNNITFEDRNSDGIPTSRNNPSVSLRNHWELPRNFELTIRYPGIPETFVHVLQWNTGSNSPSGSMMLLDRVITADGTVLTSDEDLRPISTKWAALLINNVGKTIPIYYESNYPVQS